MKLIIAILRDADSDTVSNALTTAEFRVTRIASTGGFLRRGYSTLLIGLEDDLVDKALDLIRKTTPPSTEPNVSSATIFVLKVDHYTRI